MKKKIFLQLTFILVLSFILTVFLVPSVSALSVNGNILSPIIFESGKEIVNHYIISNTNKDIVVSLNGDFEESIQLSEVVDKEFDLTIKFPEKLPSPGTYSFTLVVKEAADPSAAIGSLIAVRKNFVVEVYSDEKAIVPSLVAPSVNEGNPVNFAVKVESKGYQDINEIRSEITVYNSSNDQLALLKTESKPLPALAKETLTASFNTTGLLPGDYWAEATVFYDSQQKTVNDTFKIGNMDILVKNYTSKLNVGFSDFKILVINNWGDQLENVYAKLFLTSIDGKEKEILQTPSINIAAWQEKELTGIVKIEHEPGEYQGLLQIFFEGENKEIPIMIEVLEVPSPETKTPLFGLVSGLLLILTVLIIIVLILVVRNNYKKSTPKNKEDEL